MSRVKVPFLVMDNPYPYTVKFNNNGYNNLNNAELQLVPIILHFNYLQGLDSEIFFWKFA